MEDVIVKDIDLSSRFLFERKGNYLVLCHYYVDLEESDHLGSTSEGLYMGNLIVYRYVFHKPIEKINFENNTLKFKGKKKLFKFNPDEMIQSVFFSFKTNTKIIGKYPGREEFLAESWS